MLSAPVFECRRVPGVRDLGFQAVSGTISGQKRKLTAKLGFLEFMFLSPGFRLGVSAVQSVA